MATGYSTNLELALPIQGELSGTWGDTVNNGITQYLDAAIAGSQIISGSQTAVTLSNTNGDAAATNIAQAGSGATGTAQYQIIRCTGNPASLLTITVSDTGTAGYSKTFIIINATSTSQSVKIVGSGPTTGITVTSGDKALVAWNGTDFVRVGASAGGSNTQVQFNSSGNLAGSANLTFDGTTLTAAALSATGVATFSAGSAASPALTTTGDTNTGIFFPAADTIAFSEGGVESMRVDSAGNLGLGVTPSAWSSEFRVMQVGLGGAFYGRTVAGDGDKVGMSANVYKNTSFVDTYITTDSASKYDQAGGSHIWYNAPSGTAGNAISFTQAMTLDASGNLLVGGTAARGTTAGAAHLDLFNGTAPAGTLTNGVSLYSDSGDLKFMNAAGTAFDVGYRNIPQNAQSGSYTLVLADSGKHIYHALGDGAATYTIPAASSVAYPLGTAITFVNLSATSVSIAITTDTMYLSSAGTTGTRTLAQYGSATAIKVSGVSSSGIWVISGSGLT